MLEWVCGLEGRWPPCGVVDWRGLICSKRLSAVPADSRESFVEPMEVICSTSSRRNNFGCLTRKKERTLSGEAHYQVLGW